MGELSKLLLTPEDFKPDYKLYVDMDGVLCDFTGRFEHFTGMSPDEYRTKFGKERFWNVIDGEIGMTFWSGMEWTPQGEDLWKFVKPYDPILLTSPSRKKVSTDGKLEWIDKNIPGTPVVFKQAKEKHKVAGPGSILIDDREDTVKRVNNAGGIGIHHPENTGDISQVIQALKDLGYGRELP
jgi:hypothetical protein